MLLQFSLLHPKTVYVWMGFQILWFGARSLVYFLSDSSICSYQAIIASSKWEDTQQQQRARVLALVTAMGQLQVARGLVPYSSDATGGNEIRQLLRRAYFQVSDNLCCNFQTICKVELLGVIGPTILRATAWVAGARIPDLQLHDPCIVFLRIPGDTSTIFAVPSIRVFAKKTSPVEVQSRNKAVLLPPIRPGQILYQWFIWVPTIKQREIGWTTFTTREMTGITKCEFLKDNEVDKRLQVREWDHTLRSSTEIARVMKAAKEASVKLLEMWQSTEE
jgi:hypothetical protein